MAKLDAELRRARQLLSEAAPSSSPSSGATGVLPIGVGLIAWAAARSLTDQERVLAAVLAHRPCALWLFAPDGPGASFATWTESLRRLWPSAADTSAEPIVVFAQVGSVREALEAVEAGVDVVVAQGADAGGHGSRAGAGIISLVPEIRDALQTKGHATVPLLAAGGVMDGRGVASVLALGADGVVLGTRFLVAREANVSQAQQQAILDASDGGQTTLRTRLFDELRGTTGWPAAYDGRALRNDTVNDWERRHTDGEQADEQKLKEELTHAYQRAAQEGDYRRLVVWAGTGVGLAREIKPAAEIVQEIISECRDVIDKLRERIL